MLLQEIHGRYEVQLELYDNMSGTRYKRLVGYEAKRQ